MALKSFLTCVLLSFASFFFGLFIGIHTSNRPVAEQSVESGVVSIIPTIKTTTLDGSFVTQGEFEEMVLNKAYEEYGIDRDTFTRR